MKVVKYIATALIVMAMSVGLAMAAQYDCKDHYSILQKQATLSGFKPTVCLLKDSKGKCIKWEYPWAVSPTVARQALIDGNARFKAGTPLNEDRNAACVNEVATNGQHPYAVVVACSDSRVGPEVVMDKGLGDVFVVRAAGHVVDAPAIGSIEYGVEHLGAQLVVVVGHQKCGAVKATIDTPVGTSTGSLNIDSLVTAIRPAVDSAILTCGTCPTCDLLDTAVHDNVTVTIENILASSPLLEEKVLAGTVKIVGGYYGLNGQLVLDPIQ